LIFHSDKGAQYTALRFTQRLVDAGIAPSTGSTGDSFDCEHPVVAADRGLTLVMTGPAGALAFTCRPSAAATLEPTGERAVT
jgi:putative transposase